MARLLIVGGASIDRVHTGSHTAVSPGGAGLYTALAAARCGADLHLFGPRPDPMPGLLEPVTTRLEWSGERIAPSKLARFEILYEGDEATYLSMAFGEEGSMEPELLPADLSPYDAVHLVPLGDADRQLRFLRACRQRGARLISAGTQEQIIIEKRDAVAEIIASADLFFMNEAEARLMFGSLELASAATGKLLFITLGASGAMLFQGEHLTTLPAVPVVTADPTGAGDTFCGAALALIAEGAHPIMAARQAMPLAAHSLTRHGPQALLDRGPLPAMPDDPRVSINKEMIKKVAALIKTLDEVAAFDFTGPDFPPVHDPEAVDWFFAATAQQFGFWTTKEGRYHSPLIAPMEGAARKGSSYFFRAYRRGMDRDPGFSSPQRQAEMDDEQMRELLRADDGADPMPAFDQHLAMAQAYGREMQALDLTPASLLARAQKSRRPLNRFLRSLDQVAGYKEDPLRKKSTLLALILNQRPEQFLSFGAQEQVAPVIDYHLMRSCLRTGLIDVKDGNLQKKLERRLLLESQDEWAVRWAAYQAIQEVTAASGKSMGAVDYFFFGARKRCPEMSEPICSQCQIEPVCAQRKALFQPVWRTTFY